MSARNQPRQFARGIGQFSPWSAVNARVRESLAKQATPRKFTWVKRQPNFTVVATALVK